MSLVCGISQGVCVGHPIGACSRRVRVQVEIGVNDGGGMEEGGDKGLSGRRW